MRVIGHTVSYAWSVPVDSIRAIARHLDVPERTLRRHAAAGLIHGQRVSPRRFDVSFREQEYLRRNWDFLQALRTALRTEPNVRLAVLFGSQAKGTARADSDIDLLVELANPEAAQVAALSGRLEQRLGRDVQLVRLQDARRSPTLLADALRDGRVIVDRHDGWAALRDEAAVWERRAARDALSSLDDLPEL